MSRSTDVQDSIAGYYYQLLLACRELCKLSSENPVNLKDGVGIEKGSDIKIFRENDGEISIEAKFYKSSYFNKKSLPIIHTIYNFHNSFRDMPRSKKYIFSTNVKTNDVDSCFFNSWPNNISLDLSEYINYVKICVVIESVKRSPYDKAFEVYKIESAQMGKVPKNKKLEFSYYLNLLISDLENRKRVFDEFCDLMEEDLIKEFIIRTEFNFSNKKKFDEIQSIKDDINNSIKIIDNNFEISECNLLMNLVMEKILNTTVTKSNVSVEEFLELVDLYKNNKSQYYEKALLDGKIISILQTIEQELIRFDEDINDEKELIKLKEEFIGIIELFYKNINKPNVSSSALDLFLGRYTLDVGFQSPMIITNLARLVSILSVYGGLEEITVSLTEEDSINNIIFNEENRFCFKETQSRNIRSTEALIHGFINSTVNDIPRLKGDEIIVFSPQNFRVGKKPCDYKDDDLDLMVSKISSVGSNIKIRNLYKDLDYRCSNCLEIEQDDEDMVKKINRFKGGCKWRK